MRLKLRLRHEEAYSARKYRQAEDLIAAIRRHKQRYRRHIDQLVKAIHERDKRIEMLEQRYRRHIDRLVKAIHERDKRIEMLESADCCCNALHDTMDSQIKELSARIEEFDALKRENDRLKPDADHCVVLDKLNAKLGAIIRGLRSEADTRNYEIELLKSQVADREGFVKAQGADLDRFQRHVAALENHVMQMGARAQKDREEAVATIDRLSAQVENQADIIREYQGQPTPIATNEQVLGLRQERDGLASRYQRLHEIVGMLTNPITIMVHDLGLALDTLKETE